MMRSTRHKSSAFTMIELLVVVAIIALLVTILVPTVTAARNLAKLTVCLSQQRSLGNAWMLYLEDSKEWFPPQRQNMQYFYGGKDPCLYVQYNPGFMLPVRPLNPYVGRSYAKEQSAEVFRCPANREIRELTQGREVTQGYPVYDWWGNCYPLNGFLLMRFDPDALAWIPGKAVSYRDVRTPLSKTVLLGDSQWYYTTTFEPGSYVYDAYFHNREDRMNATFLDGHAATIQFVLGKDVTPDYTVPIYYLPDPPGGP